MKKTNLKFDDFVLINNAELNEIHGRWKACAPIAGDIHSCASYESKCPSGFTYKMCATLESASCPKSYSIKKLLR